MSPQAKLQELTAELKQHNYDYYVLANPTISDREFDMKLKELEKLEQAFPQYTDPNSPTQQVGGGITKNFETVPHSTRMLSLGNTYNKEELLDFDKRVAKLNGGNAYQYTAELKFDGFAIALRYADGKLSRAITRGDGTQGDDVTANVKTIRSIPHQLRGNYPPNLEVRGEIFMHKAAFAKLNEERANKGEDLYKNPRNTAAGTIKLQDSAEVAKRPLDGFLYQLAEHGKEELDHWDSLQRMKEYGLPVNDATQLCDTIEDVWTFIEHWDTERKNLSFEIDGVVIKVNSRLQQQEMGFTSKFPRWAMSYKFETERAESKLLSISYQVGRTGAVTPVANLEPMQLLGTTVKRASLHNADFIAELDIRIGDRVFVEKGGEIIPKIVEVDASGRGPGSEPTQFTPTCPECETLLERPEGDAVYRCPNTQHCPPQVKGRIEHFIGRKAMDVASLGEGKIDVLYQSGLVRRVADLYSLQGEQLLGLSKSIINEDTGDERIVSFKEKTVENIVGGIQASKQIPFERVLFGLGIRFVGETVAKKLAFHFKNIDALIAADFETLNAVSEIGGVIAKSVIDYFSIPENREEIEQMKVAGLQFEVIEKELASNALDGAKIVVSGVFNRFSRNELKKLIEDNGGKNVSSISKSTDFIVAGDSMGPAKKEKAEKLGVRMITEDEFAEMLG
ncbi:MAG: NAD-dependent DNA ligase LigA [Bacteroidetes bacterium]|nr:NAD-dependent DNA ligase LigA [Bacteroidota bacterium]